MESREVDYVQNRKERRTYHEHFSHGCGSGQGSEDLPAGTVCHCTYRCGGRADSAYHLRL